jgi:hypothetical protein
VQGDQLRDLVSIYDIGKERLEQEVGTDRLSTIATQAIAVAVSSVRTETGLLAIAGKLLAVLRAPALLFYVFARDAQYRSRTGIAINAAALAAGLVILATHIFAEKGPYNAWLLALSVAAIVAPMAFGIFIVRSVLRRSADLRRRPQQGGRPLEAATLTGCDARPQFTCSSRRRKSGPRPS